MASATAEGNVAPAPPSAPTVVKVACKRDYTGLIIGRGGETIKAIQHKLGIKGHLSIKHDPGQKAMIVSHRHPLGSDLEKRLHASVTQTIRSAEKKSEMTQKMMKKMHGDRVSKGERKVGNRSARNDMTDAQEQKMVRRQAKKKKELTGYHAKAKERDLERRKGRNLKRRF